MIATINGKECSFEPGECIVDIAKRNGIEIPTLCHHESLRGQGCCRVCMVEQDGKEVPACITKLTRDCKIETESEKIKQHRAIILALLQRRAPNSELINEMCKKYGAINSDRLKVAVDADKCILCGLCARACKATGSGAISTLMRGTQKYVGTPYDEESADCVGCGSCAKVCPTGAIEIVETEDTRTIWHKTFKLVRCRECGEIIGTEEEIKAAAAKAGHEPEDLCPKCRQENISDVMAHTYGVAEE